MALRNDTFREWIVDAYTYFSHKAAWREGSQRTFIVPGWVPAAEQRRLRSYAMLEAYYRNASRFWLAGDADNNIINERREYGDVTLLVAQVQSSVAGVSQTIQVKGAVEAEPVTNDPTDIPDPNAPATPEELLQEALEQWAEDDNFSLKFVEAERMAQKLGDAVYVVYWDEKKQRPCSTVYDAGLYFPVFDPEAEYGQEDFPHKVNIVWEYEKQDTINPAVWHRYVRRLQWSLVEYEEGYTTAPMPWAEGVPTTATCWYSDGIWEIDGIGEDPEVFNESRARWLTDDGQGGHLVDLGIDFLPVIHLPNDVQVQNHYGTALISHVMQLIDDIIANDTDIQRAGSLAGSPPIAIEGQMVTTDDKGRATRYGPGEILELGGGKATVIDTSAGLKALLDLKDALLERLSVNIRIPEALLGRVKPNEVPSGIAITLSFTPHTGLVQEMRMVRDVKYPLLFKFVSRMLMLHGKIGAVFPVQYVLGSFLPADKQETMTLVMNLYSTKVISLETAVQMLIDSGYPIYSIVEEIDRIMKRDYSSASSLAMASGDLNDARRQLGLKDLPPDQMDQFGTGGSGSDGG